MSARILMSRECSCGYRVFTASGHLVSTWAQSAVALPSLSLRLILSTLPQSFATQQRNIWKVFCHAPVLRKDDAATALG